MFSKRALAALLIMLVGLAPARVALAADVLDAIPSTALAVVVVNRLEATSNKIETLAAKVQAPAVSLLSLARVQTNIHEALDDKATAAMAWLPAEEHPIAAPVPIVILPVTDYAKFLAQLQPDNAADKITQVYVAGQPALACQKGNFAILTGAENEQALKDVLASVKSVGEDLAPLRTWLNEVDVAAVATPAVIKTLSTVISEQLAGQIEILEQQGAPGGAGGEALVPALKLYQQMLAAAGDELRLAAIGVRADEAGRVRISTRLRLTAGGSWATTAAQFEAANKQMLAGFPEGSLVMAAGVQYSQPLRNMMGWFLSDEGRKLNPQFEKLSPEQHAKLADLFTRMLAQQENARLWVGSAKPDEPLLANAILLVKVEDTKKYFEQIEELAKAQLGDNGRTVFGLGELKHIQIDGRDVIESTTTMQEIEANRPATATAAVKGIMLKIMGSEEKFHTYITATDEHTIVSAYVSQDNLRRAIAAVEKLNGSKGGLDPQAAEIAALLPAGAQVVALVEPGGVGQWVQRLTTSDDKANDENAKAAVPEFPSSPPIGLAMKVSSGGVHGETVISAATLEAIGQFVANVRNSR